MFLQQDLTSAVERVSLPSLLLRMLSPLDVLQASASLQVMKAAELRLAPKKADLQKWGCIR